MVLALVVALATIVATGTGLGDSRGEVRGEGWRLPAHPPWRERSPWRCRLASPCMPDVGLLSRGKASAALEGNSGSWFLVYIDCFLLMLLVAMVRVLLYFTLADKMTQC